ncbi:hypothetical protein V6Z11_A01G178400 [Gossypium hirsutum]
MIHPLLGLDNYLLKALAMYSSLFSPYGLSRSHVIKSFMKEFINRFRRYLSFFLGVSTRIRLSSVEYGWGSGCEAHAFGSFLSILGSVSILMRGSLRICRLPELELLFGILLGCFWDRLVPSRKTSPVR